MNPSYLGVRKPLPQSDCLIGGVGLQMGRKKEGDRMTGDDRKSSLLQTAMDREKGSGIYSLKTPEEEV